MLQSDFAAFAQKDNKGSEELYLMRNLENTLANWMAPDSNIEELGTWIIATRTRLTKLKIAAEEYEWDKSIINSYRETLELLDEYEKFIANTVLIELIVGVHRKEISWVDYLRIIGGTAISTGIGGAKAGTMIGTAVFPGVGTIKVGIGGAVAGVLTGIVIGAQKVQGSINSNDKLSEQEKAKRLVFVNQLIGKCNSLNKSLKNTG